MAVLSVQGLRKSYGAHVAVDDVSFAVERGEIFGLLGPNGAGKSTTIAMCVGLLQPDAGSLRYGELEGLGDSPGLATDPAVRRRIGLAPQNLALYEELSAHENLRFFARVQGLDSERLARRVEWALELAGLVKVRFERVSTFSGGMKRRLNLAVAVVHEPDVVLLDEPTVGVDPQSRNAIFERVEALREAGRTILYTTHYMEEAERLCDRIAIIDDGKLIGLDTVDGLIREHGGTGRLTVVHDAGEEVLLTNEPVDALNHLRRRVRVETFRYQPPSLQDVFLHLTGRELRD